jgi:hypothetical protein
VEKFGYGIIDELKMCLSHLLEVKKLMCVAELIGIDQPQPVNGCHVPALLITLHGRGSLLLS